MKFDSEIKITSYPLTPSWNKLHLLMHNIVLHITIYLFPWFHILSDISVSFIMSENMRFRPYSYPCFFGTLIFDGWSV